MSGCGCSTGVGAACGPLANSLKAPGCGLGYVNPLGLRDASGRARQCCRLVAPEEVAQVHIKLLIPRGVSVELRTAPAVDSRTTCSPDIQGGITPVVPCETYAGLADDQPLFFNSKGDKCRIEEINCQVDTCHAIQLVFTTQNCCDRVSSGATSKILPQIIKFEVNGTDRDTCNFEYRPVDPSQADPSANLFTALPNWRGLPDPRAGDGFAMTSLANVTRNAAYRGASIVPAGQVPSIQEQGCELLGEDGAVAFAGEVPVAPAAAHGGSDAELSDGDDLF